MKEAKKQCAGSAEKCGNAARDLLRDKADQMQKRHKRSKKQDREGEREREREREHSY